MDYKYQKVYQRIVDDIESGALDYNQKIPSIRTMTKLLEVSKTTVENAYDQLCVEGYVEARKNIGYYVSVKSNIKSKETVGKNDVKEKVIYQYDFSGQNVDVGSFNMEVWKKYIKKALTYTDELHSYGSAFGQRRLLVALQHHSHQLRGFIRPLENYVVAAGFQTLLRNVCTMFKPGSIIAMDENTFIQAQVVFQDCGNEIVTISSDSQGMSVKELKNHDIDVIYINSSSGGNHGKPIKRQRRSELIKYAREKGIYIIEDDHNGELKYQSKVINAMAYDDDSQIFYIGSFSKLLLPSIRLSYMVLPTNVVQVYKEKHIYYHQTASKLEQIALAMYMEDGQLVRHLKRLRKLYASKAKLLLEQLSLSFRGHKITLYETSLKVAIEFPRDKIDSYIEQAKRKGILVLKNNKSEIIFSFSSIDIDDIIIAIEEFKKIIDKNI